MNCLLGEQRDEQYETVMNGSDHETRNRHVAVNEYETVTNGNEYEARNRHVAMNEYECRKVTVNS